jgi:hypothetical protein
MHGKGRWKEVMESEEARFIRESAETTYRLRRRARNIGVKQDGQRLVVQESVEDAPVQDGRGHLIEILEPTREQHYVNCTADILQHTPSESTTVTSLERVWWDSSLPSAHYMLRSDIKHLMTFLDVIFPLQFGFYDLSENTDRSWLLCTLVDTEPLYKASLSVTVSYEASLRNDNQNEVTDLDPYARRLQIEALRGLQQCVDELGTELYSGKELLRLGMQALATMTQLLSLEVFNCVEGQWEMHLQAAHTILSMFQTKWAPEFFAGKGLASGTSRIGGSSTDILKALTFFITSFVWVDIIANASHGPPPPNRRHFEYIPLLKNGILKPQEIMGCQSCILIGITDITALETWKNTQKDQGILSVVQLVARATSLNDRFALGIQALECRICTNPTNLKADSEAVNLVFAYAALVYLHTVVSGPSPHTPEIKHNVIRCLERLEALPSRLLIRNCWPFTIAGCMATEDQYDRFRDVVTRVLVAKDVLGTTWKGLKVMEECWRLRKSEPRVWCWRTTMMKMQMKVLLI